MEIKLENCLAGLFYNESSEGFDLIINSNGKFKEINRIQIKELLLDYIMVLESELN